MPSSEKKDTHNSVSSRVRLIFFLLGFIALVFLSELIYSFTNKSQLGVHAYLKMAQVSAQKADLKKTLRNLAKAAEIRLENQVAQKYPDIEIETQVAIPTIPNNESLNNAFLNFLKSIDYETLKDSYASKWAKPFYKLGLLAYVQKEPELVVPFWEIGVNLAPEWSYLHVELANFYLTQGNSSKATSTIDYCLTFQHPKDHCQEYLEKNIKYSSPVPVGSWEAEINAI